MASPRRNLDYRALLQLPDVRAIAAAIRKRWNLWIGLVTRAGLFIPIHPTQRRGHPAADLPVCELFKGRSDSAGGCARSMTSWAGGEQPDTMACHAHLEAVVVPLGIDTSTGASLYVSGFLAAERDYEPIAGMLDRADALDIPRSKVAGLVDAVPRLDRGEKAAIRYLLEAMAESIRSAVEPNDKPRESAHDYSGIIGQSPEMMRLFKLLDRVVVNDSTVLIEGENGTGKELFARAIHANSRRHRRAFVSQNCSDINDNLLESELFGHRRGAFTGAIADKRGLFERSDGGTLFLDEVGDMSPTMQVKLLRVLQESTFLPVGDTVTRTVDVRVIAASNRNLQQMVADGSFREDLFYRLNVINLVVPPLRRRTSDLPLLVAHFLGEYAHHRSSKRKTLSAEVMRLFRRYHWPGNVRELRHELERLVVLSGELDVIPIDFVSPRILQAAGAESEMNDDDPSEATLPEAVEALERQMISAALEQTDWNKTRAAKILGVSRRNLIRKVQYFGLKPSRSG